MAIFNSYFDITRGQPSRHLVGGWTYPRPAHFSTTIPPSSTPRQKFAARPWGRFFPSRRAVKLNIRMGILWEYHGIYVCVCIMGYMIYACVYIYYGIYIMYDTCKPNGGYWSAQQECFIDVNPSFFQNNWRSIPDFDTRSDVLPISKHPTCYHIVRLLSQLCASHVYPIY